MGLSCAFVARLLLGAGLVAGVLVPASARAEGDTVPAPAPTPTDWRYRYDEARQSLILGQFTEAYEAFTDLERTAANDFDRQLAHEQRELAYVWAMRRLALVERGEGNTSSGHLARASDRRTLDELVSLYTNGVVYGIGTAVFIDEFTQPSAAAGIVLPLMGLTGAAVAGIALGDTGRGYHYGVPQSIVSGMYIGLEEGIVWSTWAGRRDGARWNDKGHAAFIWSLSTLGGAGGGLLGGLAGTTPGRASWVGSTAAWTGFITGFLGGAFASEDDSGQSPPQSALLSAGVGLTLGTGIGILTASSVSPAISRVRFLDLGGAVGALLGVGGYAVVAGNDEFNGHAAAGCTALGAVAGLAATWAITSSIPEDRLAAPAADGTFGAMLENARPTVAPAPGGGAMLGLGGTM